MSETPRTKREFLDAAIADMNLDVSDSFTALFANACALLDQRNAEREATIRHIEARALLSKEIMRLTAALSAAEQRAEAMGRDAARYRCFRAFVSKGDLSLKHVRAAFDMWFARFYPEADLDAAIDKAMPNLIDAFNGAAPFPDITAAIATGKSAEGEAK